MTKKKILYIVESFGSGVFSFLVDLINSIYKDYEIIVAYGKRKETLENFKEYFPDEIKFIEVKNFTRSINPKKDLKALLEIRKILKIENPDIVHLHSSKAGVIGRVAVHNKKIKMFYNPHGFSFLKLDDSKLKRFIYRSIEKVVAIINHSCTIIGCSEGEYEEAKKLNKNAVCINNGINIEKLKEETKDLELKEINYDDIKICTVGRIGFQKNPKVFNEIASNFPDIQFTWIGDGELKDELTSPNIKVTGWIERKDVLKELNNNDIFILPSLWEGLPISLLEAMYMGKICVVSNVIGNRDVIEDGKNGYIAVDDKSYNNIINKIIEEKNNTVYKNAKKMVEISFNINKMTQEYKNIYGS